MNKTGGGRGSECLKENECLVEASSLQRISYMELSHWNAIKLQSGTDELCPNPH